MRHFASRTFWARYDRLPEHIRALADTNFTLLKGDPKHPSLHFKRIGDVWTVRVGISYRAIGKEVDGDLHWHWIGSHADYDREIS